MPHPAFGTAMTKISRKKNFSPSPFGLRLEAMKKRNLFNSHIVVALVATFLLSDASNAATTIPVTSGSFENPDLTFPDEFNNWANLDLAWSNGTQTFLNYEQNNGDNMPAHTGIWSALLAGRPELSQSLATTVNAGDTLTLIFQGGRSTAANVSGGGFLSATFDVGGTLYTTVFDTTDAPQAGWKELTLTHTITNTGNLSLRFDDVSGAPWLDSIGNVTSSAIPEPSALLLLSIGALGLLRRRRA